MSQFIEMFGTVKSTKPLTDFIDVSFPGEWGQEDKDGSGAESFISRKTECIFSTTLLSFSDVKKVSTLFSYSIRCSTIIR